MKNVFIKIRQLLNIAIFAVFFFYSLGVVNARILFQNATFENDGDTFLIDADSDSPDNVSLQFGATIGETLTWDVANSKFNLSNNLSVTGGLEVFNDIDLNLNVVTEFRFENLASAPTCDVNSNGRVYQNMVDNSPYLCNGTIWVKMLGSVVGGNNLDEAYDQNGSGNGRTIYADTGAVEVLGDGLTVDNISINDNLISSLDSNGSINFDPNGTGTTNILSDLNVSGNNVVLDSDDSGGNVVLSFGSALNEMIFWDNANSRFTVSDSFRIEGDAGIHGSASIANDHSVANSDGILALGLNDSLWETIQWSSTNDWFNISDDVHVDGDITVDGNSIFGNVNTDTSTFNSYIDSDFIPTIDLAYNLGAVGHKWNVVYANSIETGGELGDDINFGESGLSFDFTNGQTTLIDGRMNTIETGDVLKVNLTGAEEVILTQTKNDSPIGVAVNNSNFGDIVRVIILGKSVIKCTGIIIPGETIQTANVVGRTAAGVNSTKVIGTALTSCVAGFVNAVVHLE